jgi:hypothetical protein
VGANPITRSTRASAVRPPRACFACPHAGFGAARSTPEIRAHYVPRQISGGSLRKLTGEARQLLASRWDEQGWTMRRSLRTTPAPQGESPACPRRGGVRRAGITRSSSFRAHSYVRLANANRNFTVRSKPRLTPPPRALPPFGGMCATLVGTLKTRTP